MCNTELSHAALITMVLEASKFKSWLLNKRFFRVGWFAKGAQLTPESDDSLATLPDDIFNELKDAVNALPVHPQETKAVLDPVKSAIAQWLEDPNSANNSIAILAQPVSPISRIVGETLSQLIVKEKHDLNIKLLDWIARPLDSTTIQKKIETQLGTIGSDRSAKDRFEKDRFRTEQITIIPNLCWCFLRSAQGLDGIDYLQDTTMNDPSQFIVLGCGQIGWEYLESTLQLHAYCDRTVSVPEITGEQLQEWIEPVIKQFDIYFSDAALHKRLGDLNQLEGLHLSINKPIEALSEITQEAAATAKSSLRSVKETFDHEDHSKAESASPKREYFDRLADISGGVSIIALQLFMKSLCYREVADQPSEDGKAVEQDAQTKPFRIDQSEESQKSDRIVAQLPKLPPLPDLSQRDLYLLYSLMLHGDLTIGSLAESLGDAPQIVNNQVQILRKQGVIEQRNGMIKANPIHYPRLRRELANNNFVIEVF